MLSILTFGFLLGLRHALEADHVATVAALASTSATGKQALRQGLAWGLGHSVTLLLVGGIAIGASALIPENIAHRLEMLVGVMMILLALDLLRRLYSRPVHFHSHSHGNTQRHVHLHSHTPSELHQEPHGEEHEHRHPVVSPLRATLVGIVHGMAGSAAVVVLLLDEVASTWTAMAYLMCFCVGSIVGMALFSIALSVPLRFTATRLSRAYDWLQWLIALFSAGIGVMLVTA